MHLCPTYSSPSRNPPLPEQISKNVSLPFFLSAASFPFRFKDNAALYLIPSCVPAWDALPCEQLHSRKVSHKLHDFLPCLVRLLAVRFQWGNDKLMDTGRPALRMAFHTQQADLRIPPGPEPQTVKPTWGLPVLFQPHKCHCLIPEPPAFHNTQGFR